MPIPSRTKLIASLSLALYLVVILRTAWITEDAYITFRTIRNLLEGFGLVWNIGERVQSYTHPLWMFLITIPIALTGEYFYTTIAVCIGVSLLGVFLLMNRLASGLAAATVAVLILALSKSFTDYSTSGLENPLTHLLLVLFFAQFLLTTQPTLRHLFWLTFVAGLIVLNRMDCGLIVLPALLAAAWQVRSWRALTTIGLAFLPLMAWEIFSLLYYGFLFPNTAYAKLNTGLATGETITQGLMYLLSLLNTDPLAVAVIGVGLVLGLRRGNDGVWSVALGIVIYLLYIVQIGGDYMAGRFFTTPLLLAVIVIARQPTRLFSPTLTIGCCALVVVLGIMNPDQAPLFAGADYDNQTIVSSGVADERGTFYLLLGLLPSSRFNRDYDSGYLRGRTLPANYVSDPIGKIGFISSPYSHSVDRIGLADALLARLPMRHNPRWRIGHPLRAVPEGYLLSLRSGQNQLTDPNLKLYYDKLRLITRGPIFDSERLLEIWRFNLGMYDALIDKDFYRFPDRIPVDLPQITRPLSVTMGMPSALPFANDGVILDLGTVSHAPFLLIGANLDQFNLHYYRSGQTLLVQPVRASPIGSAGHNYQAVEVPDAILAGGYDAIHLYSMVPDSYDSKYMDVQINATDFALTFFDLVGKDGQLTTAHAEQLSELYLYFYYRAQTHERYRLLQKIFTALQAIDPAQWQGTSVLKLAQLYQLSDPTISNFALERLPNSVVLKDSNGKPQLRYLGVNRLPSVNDGVGVELYFEVLADVKEDYSGWFHIKSIDGAQEWMVYDYFPEIKTAFWREALVIKFPVTLKVEIDEVDVTFGFWTAQRKRLYVDAVQDIYWVNLGKYRR